MPKTKYKYNPETLSYEQVKTSRKLILGRVFLSFIPIAFVLALFYTAKVVEIRTAQEVKQENDFLRNQNLAMHKRAEETLMVLEHIQEKDNYIYRSIFETEPYPQELRNMGTGGSNRYTNLEGHSSSDIVIQLAKKLDRVEKRLYAQSKSFDEVIDLAKTKQKMLHSIPSIQPVSNGDLKRLASGFGWRNDPHYHTPKFHEGMDFTAPRGTEIYSTGDGKVVKIERKKWGYGKSIVIDHGFGYKTRYAHLNDFKVKKGQIVKRGELIGLVGNTGKSTAPHLHYEVIKGGRKVNPARYYHNDLSPEEYEKMLEISSGQNQSFD